ncbi:MAG TPA: tetratricopeptide repeat protein [Acidobacteriota bacterium]|nr:tetratricopeptide repeat protein [Acidobacteriota bacterium]
MNKKTVFIVFCMILLITPFYLSSQNKQDEDLEKQALIIFNKYKDSVIALKSLGEEDNVLYNGTGFAVGEKIIATNYHLISQANSIEGTSVDGKKVKIKGLVDYDKETNIALLEINKKPPVLPIGNFNSVEFGSKVFLIGSNQLGQIRAYPGEIINIAESAVNIKVADSSITAGDEASGGPVFDENGQVVGIIFYPEGSSSKVIVPISILERVNKNSSSEKIKRVEPEDYFSTLEGAYLTGHSFAAINNMIIAENNLEKVVEKNPQDIETKKILAEVYTKGRAYNLAVSTYQDITQLNPESDEAYLKMGTVYIEMRKWKEAIPPLEKAIELNPDNTSAYYNIGRAYEELKDYEKAIENYKKYIESEPQDLKDTYLRLGIAQLEIEDFQGAADSLQKAIKNNPDNDNLKYRLAETYQKIEQYEDAAKIYTTLAEDNPDDAKVYFNMMVKMYDEANMPDKAIESAKKLIELQPKSADAYYNVGYMYVKQEQYQEAIPIFKKAIELNPDLEYAYQNLAVCYSKINQYSNSIQILNQLVDRYPNNADAWLSIAVNYLKMKQWRSAIDPLRKTIELEPNNAQAYYNLGIAYLNLRDNASAREVYLQLKKIDPGMAQRLLKYFR